MKNRFLLIWLFVLSIMLACAQFSTFLSTVPPQPTSTPIPGWERFEGRGIELWLPESFEGGDPGEDVEILAENLGRLGPDFEQMVEVIEQNPSLFVLWAYDAIIGDSGVLTNVTIAQDRVMSAITIETYHDIIQKQLPPQFQIVDRATVSLGDYPAGRIETEFTVAGIAGKQLVYSIKDGNTIWTITFSTGSEEFDQRLVIFEEIVLTVAIQD